MTISGTPANRKRQMTDTKKPKYKGYKISIKTMGPDDARALIMLIALGNGSLSKHELQARIDCDFNWLVDAQFHLENKKGIRVTWEEDVRE